MVLFFVIVSFFPTNVRYWIVSLFKKFIVEMHAIVIGDWYFLLVDLFNETLDFVYVVIIKCN
jgi:hypothetical protein